MDWPIKEALCYQTYVLTQQILLVDSQILRKIDFWSGQFFKPSRYLFS